MTLFEISTLVNGEITGDAGAVIERVAKIEEAGPGDITFLANLRYKKHLSSTKATAVLIARDAAFEELAQRSSPPSLLRVDDPYVAFLQLLEHLHPAPSSLPRGIHATAVIAPTAILGNGVAIGAHVVIGERCVIRDDVSIYHGCVIGDEVIIGEGSTLHANISIREQCKIGKRVIIHSGTVVGSDGFGFAPESDGTYKKIPQRGIVVIEDDTEIGANCTVDRATIGETRIKRGVKLDNLIHIAHNVVIGENTVIAAQTGISGSTKIGKNCILAGQVGIAGHVEIADNVTLGAQSGVSKSLKESGKVYFGYPAKELHQALRMEVSLRHLPELVTELRELTKRCSEIERALGHPETTSSGH